MDTLLLSIVTFVPAMAALILLVVARGEDAAAGLVAKRFALVATTATFIISLFILWQFDPSDTGFQMVEEADWLLGLKYKLGVDGISILFVMLTTFMMPLVIAASWGVNTRVKEYMIAFLLLETLMLGVFMALDLVLFYLFFEAGLIPMFLIIVALLGAPRARDSDRRAAVSFRLDTENVSASGEWDRRSGARRSGAACRSGWRHSHE